MLRQVTTIILSWIFLIAVTAERESTVFSKTNKYFDPSSSPSLRQPQHNNPCIHEDSLPKQPSPFPSSFDPNMTEYWFDAVVDHFNFRPTTPSTFPLRYFVNDQYYTNSSSPILLYAGNEAPITQFIKNSGFLWEAAQQLGAMVVFAEHRYYGQSFPFGKDNPTDSLTPHNISYLTVEQAMEDFNTLTLHLRKKWNMASDAAFIVTGGSYGGNLALWLRLKNPNLWAGALASSATPLKHKLRESNAFAKIVANVYGNVSSECPELIRDGYQHLFEFVQSQEGRENIQDQLQLCSLPTLHKDQESAHNLAYNIYGRISGALETMVQYGYPYPTEFYNPVPGYPFRVACQNMLKKKHSELGALLAAAQVYYNYTGQAGSCFDWFPNTKHATAVRGSSSSSFSVGKEFGTRFASMPMISKPHEQNYRSSHTLGDKDWTGIAWGYQLCTEVYQPIPTDGKTDIELPYQPNQTEIFRDCLDRWGVTPRPNWEEMTFMGENIQGGSNLFLTSGQLDPWRAAGIQSLPKKTHPDRNIVVRIIENGAHHLDLRSSHPLDPPSVTKVRKEELESFEKWIQEWREMYPPAAASNDSPPSDTPPIRLAYHR